MRRPRPATSEPTTDFGARLRRLREAGKLTQTAAAQRAGIRQGTWSDLESGRRNPRLQMLRKLAEALRVPIARLVA